MRSARPLPSSPLTNRATPAAPSSPSTGVFPPVRKPSDNGDLMPHLTTDDGVKLYYEETGKGIPIVFVHEFAGDCRSWEQQVRHFGKYYRCITYNARGYPPSDIPKEQEKYSQE